MLSDRAVIVSGGTRGIGKAIVKEFAKQGADVAFSYIKNEQNAIALKEEIEKEGRRALIFKSDVNDYESMKNMVDDVKSNFGRLDIVVNNAGIVRDKALMLMEKSDWDEVISTNLSGTFNLTRAAIVTFLKQKSGNIINISSVAGVIGMPRQVNYSASKAGIIGFTKALAKEVGPYNIRVNAIAPGFTNTDMIQGLKEEYKDEILKGIPLGRFGEPEEVAKVALFLASEGSQ
ncbi:3-oxoacyl-ACP reductase family protein, partial [Candidatus Omnitrophota bacterium]